MSAPADELSAILDESRRLGYLGPGPVETHLAHALGFVDAVEHVLGRAPESFADLGTGGGVPGLVLATSWPRARGALIEASVRRCEHLREWCRRLGIEVEVVEGRAEDLAHDAGHREAYEAVTARGFGPPPATAEVGAAIVQSGGVLVVSEPPGGEPDRWPRESLTELGLAPATIVTEQNAAYAVIRKVSALRNAGPRRRNQPWKRPLW